MGSTVMQKPGWRELVRGHLITVGATVRHGLRPVRLEDQIWSKEIENEFGDPIHHSGRFLAGEKGESTLAVILHGLGGDVGRGYCVRAAQAAREAGYSSLRLALRGADGIGEDFYHAGFTDSLRALLRDRRWEKVERIALIGYSLGGSVALKAAAEKVDPRVAAVVAICPPLDLQGAQVHIDGPGVSIYRKSVLDALKRSYWRVSRSARRAGMALPPEERIRLIRTLREWDQLTVAPRFGFESVEEYYRSQSVGPRLKDLKVPTLVAVSPADPMIPADSLRGALGRASSQVEARWIRGGGHVFFPPGAGLDPGGKSGSRRGGIPEEIFRWLSAAGLT